MPVAVVFAGPEVTDEKPGGSDATPADVVQLCASIISDLSRHAVLVRTVEAAQQLTQARYAAIGLADAGGRIVDFAHIDPQVVVPDESCGFSHAQVMLAMVAESSSPLRFRHLADHPATGALVVHPASLESLLAVALRRSGCPQGVLYLANSAWGEFDEDDERAVSALAGFSDSALEQTRLLRGSDERRLQCLVVSAAELKQRVVEIFDETRSTSGLGGSVYFAGMAERELPAELAADVEVVVRQGLSDLAEHAGVGVIVVGVSLTDTLLTIDLIDDGSGTEEIHRTSFADLRRRAQTYGGSLEFSSGASRGTFLRWSAQLES